MIKKFAVTAILSAATLSTAQAGVIVSAQSAAILAGGPGLGSLPSTYNMYGLINEYTSGETSFEEYIASRPLHAWNFSVLDNGTTYYNEWFSEDGTASAIVSYDLGETRLTEGLALWNEDGNGIGKLNILGSTDGQNWVSLGSALSPTNHAAFKDYGADVFAWSPTSTRYIKLEMSACPSSATWKGGCSIGEVAFHATTPVPEPGTLALAGLGLSLLGAAVRRHRQA